MQHKSVSLLDTSWAPSNGSKLTKHSYHYFRYVLLSLYNPYNMNQLDALFIFQFISIINLYMFRAGILLTISRYCSVCTAVGMCHADDVQ